MARAQNGVVRASACVCFLAASGRQHKSRATSRRRLVTLLFRPPALRLFLSQSPPGPPSTVDRRPSTLASPPKSKLCAPWLSRKLLRARTGASAAASRATRSSGRRTSARRPRRTRRTASTTTWTSSTVRVLPSNGSVAFSFLLSTEGHVPGLACSEETCQRTCLRNAEFVVARGLLARNLTICAARGHLLGHLERGP